MSAGLSYTKSGPDGGMLVALANSRNVAEVCTTARLKKTFDKRRLWEVNSIEYTFTIRGGYRGGQEFPPEN